MKWRFAVDWRSSLKRKGKLDALTRKLDLKIHDVTVLTTTIITIHILTNISRSKINQTTKFGQLIKHKVRNFF